MTRLEFIETMRALFPDLKINDTDSMVSFKDFNIYFSSTDIKIKGKIPYALAKDIFNKYTCEKLDIKTGTIGTSSCPDAFFTDDEYEYELNKNVPKESIHSRSNRLEEARQACDKRPNEQKYMQAYRIGTKEGLIIVIKEIKNYYSKRKPTQKRKQAIIDQTINAANLEIINKISPQNSNYLWMMQGINFSEYFQGLTKTNNTPALKEFRRALDEFDRCVNPFMENDLPKEEILQDLNSLRISVWPFSYEDEFKDAIQYYTVVLEDQRKNSEVRFGVNPAGFSYSGSFALDNECFVSIRHYYNYDSRKHSTGEILSIHYFGKSNYSDKLISFNITYGTIEIDNKKPIPATDLQVASIYQELIKATKLAADLTINNFSRNRVPK